jgi:hypothetical protein
LSSINQHRAPSRKQLRSFGLLIGGFFFVVAFSPVFRHQHPRRWATAASVISGLLGIFAPATLRVLYRTWMALGECLGWINSKVLLGGLFYMLITPTRILMMIAGRDSMNRKFDRRAETYRVIRKARHASHMTHQF